MRRKEALRLKPGDLITVMDHVESAKASEYWLGRVERIEDCPARNGGGKPYVRIDCTVCDEAGRPTNERRCIAHWYVFGRCG